MTTSNTDRHFHRVPLALFGAPPAFDAPVPLHRPHWGRHEVVHAWFDDMLRGSVAGTRPLVAGFEQRISDALEVEHVVGASNAGTALEMTVRALEISGEVILPAFMSASAAHTLQRQGITPVFCDIDPRTRTLDPRRAASLITPRTTGIIAAHLWGQPADVGALEALARKHGLRLILDARHAFGCLHRGRMIGGFGDAEVFGLDSESVLYAGGAGAVSTRNAVLARRLRVIQNLGFDEAGASVCLGMDGTINAACAALGLASLEGIHTAIQINQRHLARYDLRLADLAGILLLNEESLEQRNFHHVVVEVDQQAAGLSRDALLSVLRAENVLATRDYYPGGHKVEPYRIPNAEAWLRLPVTERLAERVLCLPAGAAVDEAAIDRICDRIQCAVHHAEAIMDKVRPPERAQLKR